MQIGAKPPQRARRQRSLARDFIEVLVIATVLYVAISFGFQTIRVDGTSMVPTLQNQDFLLATKFSYHLHDPERGDIIVLRPPTPADANKDFIKRIVGMPGDTIEIDGGYSDHGTGTATTAILIKPGGHGPWQRLTEPYLPADPWVSSNYCCQTDGTAGMATNDQKPQAVSVPADQYFVLGDNRNESRDSRFIGLIPRANILAKASLRMFPLGRIGGLGDGPRFVPAAAAGAVPLIMPAWRRRLAGAAWMACATHDPAAQQSR